MKNIKYTIVTLIVGLLFPLLAPGQIILSPDADTYVDGHSPGSNYGSEGILRARSNAGAPRAQYTYIRFDLSSLPGIESGASFSLTADPGSPGWTGSQLEVYGLPSLAAFTSQDWDPLSLTYNTTGSELLKPLEVDVDPLNTADLVFLGNMPSSGDSGFSPTLSGLDLDSFLSDRLLDGGLVTLIVANTYGSDRSLRFLSSEAASGAPSLTVTPIPEPSTYALIFGGLALTFVWWRRKHFAKS